MKATVDIRRPGAALYGLETGFHTKPGIPGVASRKIGGVAVVALPS